MLALKFSISNISSPNRPIVLSITINKKSHHLAGLTMMGERASG